MSTFPSQIAQPGSSTCYRRYRHAITALVFSLSVCSGGLQAQTLAKLLLTGPSQVRLGGTAQYSALISGVIVPAVVWSVNGYAGGANSTGLISASGLYSPASTIWAGHPV